MHLAYDPRTDYVRVYKEQIYLGQSHSLNMIRLPDPNPRLLMTFRHPLLNIFLDNKGCLVLADRSVLLFREGVLIWKTKLPPEYNF